MPIYRDTTAKVLASKTFGVEEWHTREDRLESYY